MKFICLLLTICISVNGFAAAGLERALDEYQYGLTVEWDQRDARAYEKLTATFYGDIARLLQTEGLTPEAITSVVERKAQGRVDLKALRLRLELLARRANSEQELVRLLSEDPSLFYQRGASWNGEVVLTVAFGVLLAAAVAYAIWWNVKYKCVAYDYVQDCDWITDSDGDRDYRCGYDRKCVEWVER